MEEYRVIRSARKTLSLEITEDLTVLVRAPYQVSQSRIEAFVAGLHRPCQGDLTPKGGVLWPSDGADAHGADHHRCSEAVRQL